MALSKRMKEDEEKGKEGLKRTKAVWQVAAQAEHDHNHKSRRPTTGDRLPSKFSELDTLRSGTLLRDS